jgi:N-acetylmuramic acid 6-phosphate etherase
MERPLDTWTTEELVTAMTATSERIPELMKQAAPAIVPIVDRMVDTIEKGGHIFVVGAGTSGRLGVLDASEIRPTFGDRDVFVAVMAGGDDAVSAAHEGAEDREELGVQELDQRTFSARDFCIGITASGTTPFVWGALKHARELSGGTALISCRSGSKCPWADLVIEVDTGEEFIRGSTRLMAGTVEKMILNLLSTVTMVRLGRTYGNLMVSVVPSNKKLLARAASIVSAITGVPEPVAREKVNAVHDVRIAALMLGLNLTEEQAKNRLSEFHNNFRQAYDG